MHRFIPRIVRTASFVSVALALAACGGHSGGAIPSTGSTSLSATGSTSLSAKSLGRSSSGARSFAIVIPNVIPNPLAFTEYPVPTASSSPNEIIKGPDGNLWFTELTGNRIGSITVGGTFAESALLPSNANSSPNALTLGPDLAVWFTEDNVGVRDAVGRIAGPTVGGAITEYDGPSGIPSGSGPYGIITGLDSTNLNPTLWFTEIPGVAEITTAGTPMSTSIWSGASSTQYNQITTGPSGTLWFTEWTPGGKIYKIDSSKTVTGYPLPSGGDPYDIVLNPADGNLWFTEPAGNKIGFITPAGGVTEFSIGITAGAGPNGITVGPDGNIWFVETNVNAIAKITTAGVVTEYPIPVTTLNGGAPNPAFIIKGPDGSQTLWVTEFSSGSILKVDLALLTAPPPTPTGVISGQVTDKTTGKAVAAATVTAVSPSQSATSTTDAGGNYHFLTLLPGTYTVSATKTGYNSASQSGVKVVAGQTHTLTLQIQPATPACNDNNNNNDKSGKNDKNDQAKSDKDAKHGDNNQDGKRGDNNQQCGQH
jgi:streptogramin lyase